MTDFSRYSPSPVAPPSSPNVLLLRAEQIRPTSGAASIKAGGQNALIRLADSIKKYGILHPLAVRPASDAQGYPYYEIVDGNRRYHAAAIIGLECLPCTVLRPDDAQCARITLIQRLRRDKLHFFDQAKAFQTLLQDYRMTQEELAKSAGLSQSAVANKLRLLRLGEEEQARIRQGKLSERHARSLLRVTDATLRAQLLTQVISQNASVSTAEEWVEAALHPHATPAESTEYVLEEPIPLVEPRETAQGREENGIHPRKFAMRDLRPLYNSIDRTLTIFRKTGALAECSRQESESEIRILIRIPKQA